MDQKILLLFFEKGVNFTSAKVGGLFRVEGFGMTPENKTTMYWTVGVLAVIIVLVVIVLAGGFFQTPPAQ